MGLTFRWDGARTLVCSGPAVRRDHPLLELLEAARKGTLRVDALRAMKGRAGELPRGRLSLINRSLWRVPKR